MKQLYYSFINCYLTYANIAWASTHKSKLLTLYRTQKHTIRVIYFQSRTTHTKPLFRDIKAMTVFVTNLFQSLSFIFKYLQSSGNYTTLSLLTIIEIPEGKTLNILFLFVAPSCGTG